MSTPQAHSHSMPPVQQASALYGQPSSSMMHYPYPVSPPWAGYGCYRPPPCPPPYPMPWPGYSPNYAPPPCYPQTPALPPHVATQIQPPAQSSSAVLDISDERFEKIMAKIKVLQENVKEDEAKKPATCRTVPPKAPSYTPSGEKILSLKPRPHVLVFEPPPVLSLEPRPVLALEPQPVLVVERRSCLHDSDKSPLVVIKQSIHQEDPVPPLAPLHVPAIEPCCPLNSEQLQEDAFITAVTQSTASTLSTTSTQLLSDTAKSTESQVAQLPQPTPFQSDLQPLPPQTLSSILCSTTLQPIQKINLIPEHALMIPLVIPRFFPTCDHENKLESSLLINDEAPSNCDLLSSDPNSFGVDNLVHEYENSRLHPLLDMIRTIEHGGFILSKLIIIDGVPSSCYNASRSFITHMLMMENFIATLRLQQVLLWTGLRVYYSYFTIGGSKLMFFNNNDVLRAPSPRFCFDPGGAMHI